MSFSINLSKACLQIGIFSSSCCGRKLMVLSCVFHLFNFSPAVLFFLSPIANCWTDVMYWLQSCPFQIWANTDLMNLFRSFMQNGAHSSLLFHCMSNLYRSLTDRHVANFCWFFPQTNWFVQIHSVTRLEKSKCTSALATCYTNI